MSWQVALYSAVVLIPLVAFTVQILFIRKLGKTAALIATAAIAASFALSLIGFLDYAYETRGFTLRVANGEPAPEHEAAGHRGPLVWKQTFDWVILGGNPSTTQTDAWPALSIPLGVSIDNLSVLMFLMVTLIATLVHVYSMGYMQDDPRYPRFFAYLSLFCFSMLGLLASPNVFMIFVFWELVGLCSYLLIGFWHEERANAVAANKSFIVNRVGDVGMLIGLGILWTGLGTFDFQELNRGLRDSHGELNQVQVAGRNVVYLLDSVGKPAISDITGRPFQIPYGALVVAGLGIFAGCVGKSAQFPLHVWLPDAMAGPTPVSALIHAATMVAAGVYLVGRFYPLFTPEVLLYIAYTGGITLFIAASIAVVQTDYKKVLAYSTISQLGFMMLGLGVGGWAAALFHLITHAFFKALLFLGAGSVYHSVHTYEMPALGGLFNKMKTTAICMLVGTLAISGVPFFSGFYSKDAILAAALNRVHESPQHFMLFLLPAVGAMITAFYMFRMWLLVFAGDSRGFDSHAQAVHGHVADEEHTIARGHEHEQHPAEHAHESGPIMVKPLVILAALSVFSGWTIWIGLPLIGTPVVEKMLEYGQPLVPLEGHWWPSHGLAVFASLLIAATGIGLALLYYAPPGMPHFVGTRFSAERARQNNPGLHRFLSKKWYFDELYHAVFVDPCLALANSCSRLDKIVIDAVVNASALATRLLSRSQGFFDQFAVDGLVKLSSIGVYFIGDKSRGIQTGRLRNYIMFVTVALVGLFAGVFAWMGR